MAKIIKLVHPTLGICAQQVIVGLNTESKIKYYWLKKYGRRKYGECSIEVVEDDYEPTRGITFKD